MLCYTNIVFILYFDRLVLLSSVSNDCNYFQGEKQLKWEAKRDFWLNRGRKQSGKTSNKRKLNGQSHGKWTEKTAKRRKKN
jgi:hypothetical protein